MASRQLFSLFLLTYLFFFFISPSHSSSVHDVIMDSSSDPDKVHLSLYYESLCPACANFMVNSLVNLFLDELISIVNFRLIPWGNAIINDSNKTIVCQHGPDECLINTVDACAINVWPDLNTHFRLFHCFESLVLEGKHSDWKSCFPRTGLPLNPVQDCYNSGLGVKLELQYADETARLNPPHTYVPWVVVNNNPLKDDYPNFKYHICKAYKGRNVPKACKSRALGINSSEKENPMDQVCYAGDSKNLASSTPAD